MPNLGDHAPFPLLPLTSQLYEAPPVQLTLRRGGYWAVGSSGQIPPPLLAGDPQVHQGCPYPMLSAPPSPGSDFRPPTPSL